jgi:Predicted dehydrogenases and related proteins
VSAPIRIGVIGSGFGARVVAPVFAATDGCEVVDIVSARDAAAVGGLCARTDIDLISVHSPPFLHVEHVERAIDARHAVLCDKPFSRNATEATQLAALAADANVLGLVNFEFRCEPARRYVKGLIDDGVLGRVEHVSWTHLSSGSRVPLRPYGWLFDRGHGGGWLGAWGSHAVDALRWWFGELRVSAAELATVITSRPDHEGQSQVCDAEDAVRAWLHSADGMSIAIDSTFAASTSIAPRVVIVGSAATVEIVADQRVSVRGADGDRTDWTAPELDGADPHLIAMRSWAVEVRDAVGAGSARAGTPTFADGLAVARVLDAIRGAAGLD